MIEEVEEQVEEIEDTIADMFKNLPPTAISDMVCILVVHFN